MHFNKSATILIASSKFGAQLPSVHMVKSERKEKRTRVPSGPESEATVCQVEYEEKRRQVYEFRENCSKVGGLKSMIRSSPSG